MTPIIRQIFSDESGNLSSVRVMGALALMVGLVLACLEMDTTTAVMSSAVAILTAGQIKSAWITAPRPTPDSAKVKAEATAMEQMK